jgi:hypothetical protein
MPLTQRHLVERVLLVAVQRPAGGLGNGVTLAVAAVVHVAAVAGVDVHRAQLHALAREQVPEHVTPLAAEGGAQHHRHAEGGDHPGRPHRLAVGVHVDIGYAGPVLDGDGEQGGRGEDDDGG